MLNSNSSDNITNGSCDCFDLTGDELPATYAVFNFVIVIFSMPIVAALGAIGNAINIYIFARPRMVCQSANTYLSALAVSDMFVVLTGVVMFWIDSARSYIPEMADTPKLVVNTLPFGLLAQTCSVYIVVMAAIDCYVKVCWSTRFPNYATPRRARLILIGVFLISAVYNSLRFGQFRLNTCSPTPDTTMLEICPTELFYQVNMIYNVYMYMIMMTILPFLLLSILNGLIMTRVQQQQRRDQMRALMAEALAQGQDTSNMPQNEKKHFKRTHLAEESAPSGDDTVTMIMVVLMFLCCNSLALVINIVELFKPDPILINYMTDVSNLLVMLNSSANFLIYVIFSQDYFELFCEHILRQTRSTDQELPNVHLDCQSIVINQHVNQSINQ